MLAIPMADLVTAGECYFSVLNPQKADPWQYASEVKMFLEKLEACGLETTRAVARPLERFGDQKSIDAEAEEFSDEVIQQIKGSVRSIGKSLEHELDGKQVVVLQNGLVTGRLRNLNVKTETQTHLLEETIRCIEVESYRAAVVMGWNLAYECIRQWSFDEKLPQVQNYASTIYPRKSAISVYEDFFASDHPLTEYEFLSVLRGPGNEPNIVRDKTVDELQHFLRQRNNLAHPNFTVPSANKTNAYIEHLLDVVEGDPFV